MKSPSETRGRLRKMGDGERSRADEILTAQDSYAYEVRDHQLWRAEQLRAEAAALKKRAVELRKLESGMIEIIQDGYKVPQDRDGRCDGPQGISRYKRFR